MSSQRIATAQEIAEGQTLVFTFIREGISRAGFVARYQGRLVAYENVCRHIPIRLDHDDNRFFTGNGGHFVCQNHGALFNPATGLCVRGPCEGSHLFSLPVEIKNGEVWMVTDNHPLKE